MTAIPFHAPNDVRRSKEKAADYIAVHGKLDLSPEVIAHRNRRLQKAIDDMFVSDLERALSSTDFNEVGHGS